MLHCGLKSTEGLYTIKYMAFRFSYQTLDGTAIQIAKDHDVCIVKRTARPSMSTHGLESLRVNKLMTNGTLFFLENVTGYSMNKGDRVFLRNCTAHPTMVFMLSGKKQKNK